MFDALHLNIIWDGFLAYLGRSSLHWLAY